MIEEMQACFDGTEQPVPPPHALHRWCSHLNEVAGQIVTFHHHVDAVVANRVS